MPGGKQPDADDIRLGRSTASTANVDIVVARDQVAAGCGAQCDVVAAGCVEERNITDGRVFAGDCMMLKSA